MITGADDDNPAGSGGSAITPAGVLELDNTVAEDLGNCSWRMRSRLELTKHSTAVTDDTVTPDVDETELPVLWAEKFRWHYYRGVRWGPLSVGTGDCSAETDGKSQLDMLTGTWTFTPDADPDDISIVGVIPDADLHVVRILGARRRQTGMGRRPHEDRAPLLAARCSLLWLHRSQY